MHRAVATGAILLLAASAVAGCSSTHSTNAAAAAKARSAAGSATASTPADAGPDIGKTIDVILNGDQLAVTLLNVDPHA